MAKVTLVESKFTLIDFPEGVVVAEQVCGLVMVGTWAATRPRTRIVLNGGETFEVDGSPADVAAKIWPVEPEPEPGPGKVK